MKARWALLLVVGGLCASGRAEVVLEEHSDHYSYPGDWDFQLWQMDPNDPNSSAPFIRIKYTDETVPYWFEATDSVTGEPADIYGITADPYLGYLFIKVAAEDGGPGARHVGKLIMGSDDGIDSFFPLFNVTGTLGTLGVQSRVKRP